MKTAIVAFVLASTMAAASPTVRSIDPAQSSARFSVAHVWVEHVTGTVPILRGSVTLPPDSVIPVAATAVLDATRISTGVRDRDGALESPDFFDATRFPQWTFASTKIVPGPFGTFEMDGNLTIHGVTQPQRLSVTTSGTPGQPSYHATGQIDRHAFGMTATRLDPTIGATVDITLDVALK